MFVIIIVPPQWSFEPSDTAIMLGSPIAIPCEASGYPTPTVTWYRGQGKMSKDFQAVPLKNSTLSVNFATAPDEGYYMCQASNDIGTGLKKVIHVNVNGRFCIVNLFFNETKKFLQFNFQSEKKFYAE